MTHKQLVQFQQYKIVDPYTQECPYVCVPGGKCSIFEKFSVLCFLETPVLRFTLLPYCQRFFRDDLKWKYIFHIVEPHFSICFIRLGQTDFMPIGNCLFLGQNYLLLVKTITGENRKQKEKTAFKERSYSCQLTTDFLACENHFFSIFQKLLSMIVFFCLVDKFFSTNSFIPASGIEFSGL